MSVSFPQSSFPEDVQGTDPYDYQIPTTGSADEKDKQNLTYLRGLLEAIRSHKGNPRLTNDLMKFVSGTSAAGEMTPSILQALQGGADSAEDSGVGAALKMAVNQGAEYAFFMGYNGRNPGEGAMRSYLHDLAGQFNSSNPFSKIAKDAIAAWGDPNNTTDASTTLNKFIKAHTSGDDLIWNVGGHIYTWKPSTTADPFGDDTFYIGKCIDGQNNANDYDGQEGADFAKKIGTFTRSIKSCNLGILDDILAGDPKNLLKDITIFLMTSSSDHYQTSISGFNETTDILTDFTNDVASKLTSLAQRFGYDSDGNRKLSPEDAEAFANTLQNAQTLIDAMPQFPEQIKEAWKTNVTDAINNRKVSNCKDPSLDGKTWGELIAGYNTGDITPDQLATAFSAINQPAGGGAGSGFVPDITDGLPDCSGYQGGGNTAWDDWGNPYATGNDAKTAATRGNQTLQADFSQAWVKAWSNWKPGQTLPTLPLDAKPPQVPEAPPGTTDQDKWRRQFIATWNDRVSKVFIPPQGNPPINIGGSSPFGRNIPSNWGLNVPHPSSDSNSSMNTFLNNSFQAAWNQAAANWKPGSPMPPNPPPGFPPTDTSNIGNGITVTDRGKFVNEWNATWTQMVTSFNDGDRNPPQYKDPTGTVPASGSSSSGSGSDLQALVGGLQSAGSMVGTQSSNVQIQLKNDTDSWNTLLRTSDEIFKSINDLQTDMAKRQTQ